MKPAKTQQFSLILDPLDWGNNTKFVLFGTVLRTTGNKFSADITVKDINGTVLKNAPFSLPHKKGSESTYIGQVTVPDKTSFPITISGIIKCDTEFVYVVAPQTPLGLKEIKGNTMPVCYQSTLFCNDNANSIKKDLDHNDFVLTWQLYNASTD